jgi:lipoprotein-releasing system permease protein
VRSAQLAAMAARYTFTRRGADLSSFLSMLSIAGIVLAITLLIVVLSVMNGFDREMRDRILGLVPPLTVKSYQPIADWQQTLDLLEQHPEVTGAAPYIQFQGLLVYRGGIETALATGIALDAERRMGILQRAISAGDLAAFDASPSGVILGVELARRLQATVGDRLSLIVPGPTRNGGGTRNHHVVISGLLDSGTELDQAAAFVHLGLAGKLLGRTTVPAVDGFHLQVTDLFAAQRIGWELLENLPAGYYANDWTFTHGNLYAAIQLSRKLIVVLLLSIIAIAAFNVVSSLVLVVIDKQSDIAILRAQGATPGNINIIFLCQGLLIALLGTALGTLLGLGLSYGISDLVEGLEHLLGIQFLTTDIYPVSRLPSDPRWQDILVINGVTVTMCFLAAIYPARRAARLPPAEALRHE